MSETHRIGKVFFQLSGSVATMAEAFRRLGQAIEAFKPLLEAEASFLHRQDWWKRSDGPPEWIADASEPEWWNDGDEPPPWGCAA
jgi:hypothetical protein